MFSEQTLDTVSLWMVTKGTAFAINLLVAAVILIAGGVLVKFLLMICRNGLSRSSKMNDLLVGFIVNVLHKVMWIFLWVIALSQIGIDVVPMIVGLGVVGFIAGFAFQDSLSNFAAGFMIMLNEPFKKGDAVETAGHAGVVTDIYLMATVLTTGDNRKITVPNSKIWGQSIVNVTANDTRRVDMKVGISYAADISTVREIIKGLLKEDPRVLATPAPDVEVGEMGATSINFVIRPWTKSDDYWPVFFDMQQRIKEAFDKNKIEMALPQMVIRKTE